MSRLATIASENPLRARLGRRVDETSGSHEGQSPQHAKVELLNVIQYHSSNSMSEIREIACTIYSLSITNPSVRALTQALKYLELCNLKLVISPTIGVLDV